MLRKRARSAQKDQQMGQIPSDGDSETCLRSDIVGQRQKTNSFFNVPGLFVGLSPMSALDCDSARSPTSPLEFKLFSNLSSAFRFPKPPVDGHQKSWNCSKVGLGSIVDSLENEDCRNLPEKPIIPLSNSKTILIGSQIRSKAPNSPTRAGFGDTPKSLPKNYPIFHNTKLRPSNLNKGSSDVLFEIGGMDPLETNPCEKFPSFSLDSKRLGSEMYRLGTRKVELKIGSLIKGSDTENKLTVSPISVASGDEIVRPLSPEEIELSEDYTCVISHGPVPKTTHIFCDCVLECHPNCQISAPSSYPTNDFLTHCYHCKKKLEDGKDIYIYRGEKAFCSCDCRFEEISIEEEQEKSTSQATESKNGDDSFEKSIFFAL